MKKLLFDHQNGRMHVVSGVDVTGETVLQSRAGAVEGTISEIMVDSAVIDRLINVVAQLCGVLDILIGESSTDEESVVSTQHLSAALDLLEDRGMVVGEVFVEDGECKMLYKPTELILGAIPKVISQEPAEPAFLSENLRSVY